MVSAESFWTFSLRSHPQGEKITRILAAAIKAADPAARIRKALMVNGEVMMAGGKSYDLASFHRVVLLGLGKASQEMSRAVLELLGNTVAEGLVITKHIQGITLPERIKVMEGSHPVPDERSLEAGRKAIRLLSGLRPDDLLLCLISGGGSALITAPAGGIQLEDMQELTRLLLACGANIEEINCLRRRLDLLKGGGLVRMANGATILSLILSDVIGNKLEVIASGPTTLDSLPGEQAMAILKKYHIVDKVPSPILESLQKMQLQQETRQDSFAKTQNIVIGSNMTAAQAGLLQAEKEGFNPYLLRVDLQGEAREAALELCTLLRQTKQSGTPVSNPACIIAGGETIVTLRGDGKGGRNTELALAAVTELADFPGVMLTTLATDGDDGTSGAAGAVVTGDTFQRAASMGMHPGNYLEQNDSYTFFYSLGDLLIPGPSGTNVNDLTFLFSF